MGRRGQREWSRASRPGPEFGELGVGPERACRRAVPSRGCVRPTGLAQQDAAGEATPRDHGRPYSFGEGVASVRQQFLAKLFVWCPLAAMNRRRDWASLFGAMLMLVLGRTFRLMSGSCVLTDGLDRPPWHA